MSGAHECPVCRAEMSAVDELMPSVLYGNEYSVIRDGRRQVVCAACTPNIVIKVKP